MTNKMILLFANQEKEPRTFHYYYYCQILHNILLIVQWKTFSHVLAYFFVPFCAVFPLYFNENCYQTNSLKYIYQEKVCLIPGIVQNIYIHLIVNIII